MAASLRVSRERATRSKRAHLSGVGVRELTSAGRQIVQNKNFACGDHFDQEGGDSGTIQDGNVCRNRLEWVSKILQTLS